MFFRALHFVPQPVCVFVCYVAFSLFLWTFGAFLNSFFCLFHRFCSNMPSARVCALFMSFVLLNFYIRFFFSFIFRWCIDFVSSAGAPFSFLLSCYPRCFVFLPVFSVFILIFEIKAHNDFDFSFFWFLLKDIVRVLVIGWFH